MVIYDVYLFQGNPSNSVYSCLRAEADLRIHCVQDPKKLHFDSDKHECFLYECERLSSLSQQILSHLRIAQIPILILCWQKEESIVTGLAEQVLYLDPNQRITSSIKQRLLVAIKLQMQHKRKPLYTKASEWLIGIGASTGGPKAIQTLLQDAPFDHFGTIIVQHMGEQSLMKFASYLENVCPCVIKNAREGEVVNDGIVYIVAQNRHLIVKKEGDGYHLHYTDQTKINYVCPSIDPLFLSLAKEAKQHALGILLTGMGVDGANGLKAMKASGACTIIQDEATCELYGMPKEAKRLQAYTMEMGLGQIGTYVKQQNILHREKGD